MELEEFGSLLEAYEIWKYERNYKEQMEEMFTNSDANGDESARMTRFKRVTRCMNGPNYELAMNIVGILNVVTLITKGIGESESLRSLRLWIFFQIGINLIFFFELITDVVLSGGVKKAFNKKFRVWPEVLCQILNIYVTTIFFINFDDPLKYLKEVKYFESIIFIRMTKLLPLLYEIATMRVIIETIRNLIGPLTNLIIVMATIFYEFAILGMLFFGGRIQTITPQIIHDASIPNNYYLVNFNDLLSSFVTLFILIVVNNWYVIVAMCVDIHDGNKWFTFYFITFYYFGVIIGLNIVVAFAIDMYSAVLRLDDQKQANEKYLVKIANQRFKKKNSIDKKSRGSHARETSLAEAEEPSDELLVPEHAISN